MVLATNISKAMFVLVPGAIKANVHVWAAHDDGPANLIINVTVHLEGVQCSNGPVLIWGARQARA